MLWTCTKNTRWPTNCSSGFHQEGEKGEDRVREGRGPVQRKNYLKESGWIRKTVDLESEDVYDIFFKPVI
jgi:hypothetical protein